MSGTSFAKKRLYPVLFMLAVTLVFISVTSIVYTVTAERIELNEFVRLRRAVLQAAGIDLPDDPGEVDSLFSLRVTEVTGDSGSVDYYMIRMEDSEETESFAVVHSGPGLWGGITAVIGFDVDLGSFTGMEIIDQNETPGLGGRIDEAWFKEQFAGKIPPLVSVHEEGSANEREFHAVTGATYSSAAVQDLMNSSVPHADSLIRPMGGAGE